MKHESRPKAAFPYSAVAADDALILLLDPDVRRLVAYIGAVERGLGYELGYSQAEADMAAHWRAAAELVRQVLMMPTFDELQRRRYSNRDSADQFPICEAS